MSTLDCGHEATPDGLTTGSALTRDDKRICYACAADIDRQRIRELTAGESTWQFVRSDSDWPRCTIITWPGIALGPARVGPVTRDNFGNRRQHITAVIEGIPLWGWYYLDRGNVVKLTRYKTPA